MMCAWKELLSILPTWMRGEVDRLGRERGQALRLRLGQLPVLQLNGAYQSFGRTLTADDLHFVINTASCYSPWNAASAASGYLTAPGGHRIGLCGEVVINDGVVTGFRSLRSLHVRIARDFPGIAGRLSHLRGNLLILGKPGSGKTTLLRDLIRMAGRQEQVAVVDARAELFPSGWQTEGSVDILTGCPKPWGIETAIRTMGPDTIAVDEITADGDCDALVQAGWCGVRILATAHGADRRDLRSRRIYKPLVDSGLFSDFVILHPDKSYHTERMTL